MNASQIIAAIVAGNFTEDEIRQMNSATQFAFKQLQSKRKSSFRTGDRVKFTTREGTVITGKIEKIMQKNIRIVTDEGKGWRVAPSLLTKA